MLAAAAPIAGVMRRMESIASLPFAVAIGTVALRQLVPAPNATTMAQRLDPLKMIFHDRLSLTAP